MITKKNEMSMLYFTINIMYILCHLAQSFWNSATQTRRTIYNYNVKNFFWHSMKCHQISIECNVYHQKQAFKDFCTFYRLVISWSKIRLTYFTIWPKSSFRLSSVSSKCFCSLLMMLSRHPIIANPNTGYKISSKFRVRNSDRR